MAEITRLNWVIGYSDSEHVLPSDWHTATVPGSVQMDMARALGLDDINIGENYKQYIWTEEKYWFYRATVQKGRICRLISGGIDYRYKVFAGEELIYDYEGLNKGFDIDISKYTAKGDLIITVVIFPAPKSPTGDGRGRSQARKSFKPAVGYGWDFHPRAIQLGIWNDCYIQDYTAAYVVEANASYTLNDNLDKAVVTLSYKTTGGRLAWTIDGQQVYTDSTQGKLTLTIDNPRLWYALGTGEQYLYESTVILSVEGQEIDRIVRKVGIRRVRLIAQPEAWDFESMGTQACPPITLELNGRQIFCKGSNWVTPELFPAYMTKDSYRHYLELVKDANMNMLRSWGGSVVSKRDFFEICDELGIMIWQEYTLSCNKYPDEPHYLQVLESEAQDIASRLRQHPCVVMLCGGNELYMGWSGMTEQSLALRTLNAVSLKCAQEIPYLMTAPVMGMRHGDYGFYYIKDMEPQQAIKAKPATAYTEFGVPALSSMACIKSFMPDGESLGLGGSWETHHGLNANDGARESWAYIRHVEEYFGKLSGLDEWVYYSQLLQSMLYKAVFEAVRRKKYSASMALNWDLCDCWPTAANNSIIEYKGVPKPAYFAIKESLKATVLSLDFVSVKAEGDNIALGLYLLNDTNYNLSNQVILNVVQDGVVKWSTETSVGEPKFDCNMFVSDINADISLVEKGIFRIELSAEDSFINNSYTFIKR